MAVSFSHLFFLYNENEEWNNIRVSIMMKTFILGWTIPLRVNGGAENR